MAAGRKLRAFTADGPREMPGSPITEIPDPPSWMRPAARRRFVEVIEYLVGLGAITAGEVALVAQYSAVFGRWVESEEAMSAAGGLHYRAVLNRQGEEASAVALPAMSQASKCLDQMRKLEAALGLSPAERGRLPATRGGEEDEMDRLLRDVGIVK